MRKTKRKFVGEVMEEIEAIKVNATQEEKSKLDFELFRHDIGDRCIYGQMTGWCDSKRSKEIYPKKYKYIAPFDLIKDDSDIPFNMQSFQEGHNLTPLEKYLYMSATKKGKKSKIHKDIITYIKEESNLLTLK